MRERGHQTVVLTGEMPVDERALVIEQFKNGMHKVNYRLLLVKNPYCTFLKVITREILFSLKIQK